MEPTVSGKSPAAAQPVRTRPIRLLTTFLQPIGSLLLLLLSPVRKQDCHTRLNGADILTQTYKFLNLSVLSSTFLASPLFGVALTVLLVLESFTTQYGTGSLKSRSGSKLICRIRINDPDQINFLS